MRKILFVDDEANILSGLQRMLRSMRHEWEMHFAPDGEAALALMERQHFDVIVSDMRMPGMSGAELLTQVRQHYPQVVRMILSGYADYDLIFKSVGPAHQFLSKPTDAETIKLTVSRACALRDLLADEKLQLIVSQMQSLPSLPSVYAELLTELRTPDPSIKKVGEVISRDLGMTAKILQMVNSAFFGLRRHITNPAEAVNLLGLETVMTLVMTIQIFSQFKANSVPGFSAESLYTHSLRVGQIAKQIAKAERVDSSMLNDAFTAGLLHDVGHLVLASNQPKQYVEMLKVAQAEQLPINEAEVKVFGATHSEVGAYLLGLWGLPNSIVETVAYHHIPGKCLAGGFTPLCAVHVANWLVQDLYQIDSVKYPVKLDSDYLARQGLALRLPVWGEMIDQAMLEQAA